MRRCTVNVNQDITAMEIIRLIEKEITRVDGLIAWLRLYPDGEPPYSLIRKLKRKIEKANEAIRDEDSAYMTECLGDLRKATVYFNEC